MLRTTLLRAVTGTVALSLGLYAWADAPTATPPATTPATQPAKAKFPTPQEVIAKMKKAKEVDSAKTQVAVIDLGAAFAEKPSSGLNLFGGGASTSFRGLIDRLQQAKDDKSIRAVLLTMNQGVNLNMAQIQEVRTEIDSLRRAGKRIFAYGDVYDTKSFLLASAATDVCMLEAGEIFMPGIGIESMFYKGALEKLGVKADYVQIGEFKGAEEPYTRSEPSPELKGELDKLTKDLLDEVVNGISASRSVSGEKVRQMIDDAMITAARAKSEGLVDHLLDVDGLRDLMKAELGDNDLELQQDYGLEKGPNIDFENPFSVLGAMARAPKESDLPKVAVIYASGVITDGDGGGGLMSEEGVGSEPMRKAFRIALRDDNVKAIVVRIDSPGGSALASEAMWQSMRRLSEKKPVIVSVGGMAASGGYYLASAGDYIYADPAGIVGSIGVVGGKMVLGGLYDKVGLTTASFSQGKNANLFSQTEPWSENQRRMVKNWMKTTYDQFTDRVMSTRKGKITDIDKVARGRIFTARVAKELGMVDELGGLDSAIVEAAKRADLDPGTYDLKTLPPAPTLQDILSGGGFSMMAPKMSAEGLAFLSLMPADVRQALSQTIQMGQLMQKRPVVLMSPYVITVK